MTRALLCSLLVTLLAAPVADAFSRDVVVQIYSDHVRPRNVLLSKGDTVVFHYRSERPGGVLVLADGSGQSPPMKKNQSWERTFWETRRYEYYMKDRPSLRGRVTVR
jgi:plastocyanin